MAKLSGSLKAKVFISLS
jgi:hypothetical protein